MTTASKSESVEAANISSMMDQLFKRTETLLELSTELTDRLDQVTHAQQDASEVAGPGREEDCPMMNQLQALITTTNRTIGRLRSIIDTLAL